MCGHLEIQSIECVFDYPLANQKSIRLKIDTAAIFFPVAVTCRFFAFRAAVFFLLFSEITVDGRILNSGLKIFRALFGLRLWHDYWPDTVAVNG